MSSFQNPEKCPICKTNNNCQNIKNKETCWCFTEYFPDEIKQSINTKNGTKKTCICKSCLAAFKEKLFE